MKAGLIALMVCVLVVGLTGTGYGVIPDLYLPYIDPGRVVIDGLGTEWEDASFYPQEYMLTTDDLPGDAYGAEMPPKDDWDVILYLAWSAPPDNMLYGYARVTDDILNQDGESCGGGYKDDCIAITCDANNDGGMAGKYGGYPLEVEDRVFYRIWMTTFDLPDGPGNRASRTRWCASVAEEAMWVSEPQWFYAAVMRPTTTENVTYAYEWKFAIWDEGAITPEESTRHINALDDVLGYTILFNDTDATGDKRDHQITTAGAEGEAVWKNSDYCNDAYLIENPLYAVGTVTAVEPTSWGAVKASFR
jgi:hypothetical protein